MTGKILIIASWSGWRHPTYSSEKLLQFQYDQLQKLDHNLDKVLLVVNGRSGPKEIDLFPDKLFRDNVQGSYGAWRDGMIANPGYEWYFFLEDDYVFNLDRFDQLMVDMWTPEATYLAERVIDNHAAVSNGMTRGNINPNWNRLPSVDIYEASLQKSWHRCFGDTGLIDMTDRYSTPFWTGTDLRFQSEKPALIVPVQML